MTKWLSIDFSTKETGYAFRNPLTNEMVVGSINGGKSKDPIERTRLIAEGIIELVEYYNLEDSFIAIEEPIITMKTKGNISLVRCNGYFLAMMYDKFNIGSVDVSNSKWASHNLIRGKRPERKQQSMAILRSAGIVPDEVINDDMADAYCIMLYVESLGV